MCCLSQHQLPVAAYPPLDERKAIPSLITIDTHSRASRACIYVSYDTSFRHSGALYISPTPAEYRPTQATCASAPKADGSGRSSVAMHQLLPQNRIEGILLDYNYMPQFFPGVAPMKRVNYEAERQIQEMRVYIFYRQAQTKATQKPVFLI